MGLIQAIMQMKRDKTLNRQHDEAFATDQALKNQDLSMKDIMNQMSLGQAGQQLHNGMVDEPTTHYSTQSMVPGLPNFDTSVPGGPTKPSADTQVVTYQSPSSGKMQYALNSPARNAQLADSIAERARASKAADITSESGARADADYQAHQNDLTRRGVGLPTTVSDAFGLERGHKVLPEHLQSWLTGYQAMRKENRVTLGPGQTLIELPSEGGDAPPPGGLGGDTSAIPLGGPGGDTSAVPLGGAGALPGSNDAVPLGGAQPTATVPPAPSTTKVAPTGAKLPSGAKVLATGGVAEPTGEFGAYLRASLMKKGYTLQNAPPDAVMQATTDYSLKAKDPQDLEQARQLKALTMQLTQAHLDQLRQQKGSTTATDIPAGTREFRIAQDLAYGKLTMQQFRSMYAYSRDTGKKLDIYDKAAQLNPNFNPAQFEMGFTLAKNPKVQQQLASMDNVTQALPDLLKFSDAATRSGAPLLNKFITKGGMMVGGKKYSDFHTAQTAFADELSGALGFGSATDMSRQMGFDMTNPNLSPDQFSSALTNVVQPFIERKRSTLLNQMGVYGQSGMNPAAGAAEPPAPPQPGGGRGAASAISVTAPDGSVHKFPDQASANKFKQLAGIK